MQDAASSPASLHRARALLDDAEAASRRLTHTSTHATGRVALAFSVVVAGGFALMLSRARPPVATGAMLTVLLMLIALVVVARRSRTILPDGWGRRVMSGSVILILAIYVLDIGSMLIGHRLELPLGGALGVAALVAAPHAANGLWLLRQPAPLPRPPAPTTANPYIVLATLAQVELAGLSTLREATGIPSDALDAILRNFDDRELVDVGWGGSGPGRNTPIALTPAGRAVYDDLRERLMLDAGRQGPP